MKNIIRSNMVKVACLFAISFIVSSMQNSSLHAQITERFGFEYNEFGAWNLPKHDSLLAKLARVTRGGDINVNVLAGGWNAMQKSPTAQINFVETDSIVKLFGRHGFSLCWNLLPNAPWAYPSKVDCQPDTILGVPIFTKHCAPEPQWEKSWIDYIKAVVERYDGDGVNDMPGLQKPIRSYLMTGEIKFGKTAKGDDEKGPFWFDSIDNLLRMHRITYQAIHEADPSGKSKLISSGALLWDLYADFPDYPDFLPRDSKTTLRQRLSGTNFRSSVYLAGFDSLRKMLQSFGDDGDGIECDYIGWHPHFSWRTIDQEFAFIHAFAGNKPIYVDDMWNNLAAIGYAAIPGNAQFNASKFPNRDWVTRINGDFPNALFTTADPHGELFSKLNSDSKEAIDWYYANGARRLVKGFVSAFGEGANIVNFSGTNDQPRGIPLVGRGWEIGWINLVGTYSESYFEKPQYHSYKMLVDHLSDFTSVEEIAVSNNPRTRAYKFMRPGNAVYILWSETGAAPSNLDYDLPNGETVSFAVQQEVFLRKRFITKPNQTKPVIDTVRAQNGILAMQLGYDPILLEPIISTGIDRTTHSRATRFTLYQNFPNPFSAETVVTFELPTTSAVRLDILDLFGRTIMTLIDEKKAAGNYSVSLSARTLKELVPGMYFYRMTSMGESVTRKMIHCR